MTLRIYFENVQTAEPVRYALQMLVRKSILATLAYEGKEGHNEVSVTFTDNEGIRAINREYRQIDAPTDVLSFPLFDYDGTSEEPPVDEMMEMLGDVVLSLETAKRQADEYGHSFEREVAFLTVHSMLHLLGYDHVNSDEEDAEMRRRQREILEGMGLSIK